MSYSKWHAIRAIDDTKQVTTTIDSEGNEIVTWADGETPISDADINAKVTELQTDFNNKAYQRSRAAEYPQLGEQLDKLFHDINNGTLTTSGDFYTALNTIKTKYPKP